MSVKSRERSSIYRLLICWLPKRRFAERVTMDEFDMSREGIRHCNIRDFLLKKDWE